MKYNFDLHYYSHDGKRFNNIYQGFEHQLQTGHLPLFKLDKELIASLKNFKRPKDCSKEYIAKLIIRRLKQIRNNTNRLTVTLGGGTDSWSIMRYCMENDIYVDDAVCHMVSFKNNIRANLDFVPLLNYLKPYKGKLIGTITEIHPKIEDLNYLNNKHWFLDTNRIAGSYLPIRSWSLPEIHKKLLPEDNVTITGCEKPEFLVEDKKLHWTVLDHTITEQMGCENIIPFWCDKENPELIVAQSYAFLDTIKWQMAENGFYNYSGFNRKQKDLLLHNLALGSTGHYFLDHHFNGKIPKSHTSDVYNRKNQYHLKELREMGQQDLIQKIFDTHKYIKSRYGHLPMAIESEENFVKSVNRYSEKIPILQDKFAG